MKSFVTQYRAHDGCRLTSSALIVLFIISSRRCLKIGLVLNPKKLLLLTMEKIKVIFDSIKEEGRRKGWLDYGLMMSEIGLHRYNAIHRIKEHKEQFDPQAVPNLYHVAEYYKAVGAELTCCCLQAYGKDFIFTQDEVKKIIEEEARR